jgi:hypothetical protein
VFIIYLTEHHINKLELPKINIDSYNPGASYCRNCSFKNRVCIFVHKNVYFTAVKLNAYCCAYGIAICAVTLHFVLYCICVFYICRMTAGNFMHCLHKLNITLKFLHSSEIIIVIITIIIVIVIVGILT